MRYRMLTATGDYSFGQGGANFWVNSAYGVAQSVMTRLLLWQGEWFLDLTDGTPWLQEILGYSTQAIYDIAIRTRVMGTPNVTGIINYSSTPNPVNRSLTVTMTIDTTFGPAEVEVTLPVGGGTPSLDYSQPANSQFLPMGLP